MPGVLRGGSMSCFGVGQYKMQTTDCCRPLFSPCNQNETKIVPLTVSNPENNGLHFVLSSFGMDSYISQEMCP